MTEKRYTEPFWVGFNNPRFPYARYGYLPALEREDESVTERDTKVTQIVTHIHIDKSTIELDRRLKEAELALQEHFKEHYEQRQSKRRSKDEYY